VVLPALAGCAVNPATGERQFTLINERLEIFLGTDADRDLSESMGLVEDPGLQAYIQALGESMAVVSERPHLPWTFRVLDDPVVNAFALPGGYVYVTRGILAHFNSEAELAGVLGHEIGHITARHGVSQVSRGLIAELGLGLGAILAPELAGVLDVASLGLGLLFLRYGRDQERKADDLGLRYMTRLGYDPTAMADIFEMLARASDAEDGGWVPGFLLSHPNPLSRRDRILAAVASGAVEGQGLGDRRNRDEYLARLDGLAYGANPRQGFFQGDLLIHPDWAMRMQFPRGWTHEVFGPTVQGAAPDERALLLLTREPDGTPQSARARFLDEMDVQPVSGPRAITVHGLRGEEITFEGETEEGEVVRGIARFHAIKGGVLQVVGMATDDVWAGGQTTLRRAMDTLQQETDAALLGVEPARIRLERVSESMSIEAFQRRFPSSISLRDLATLNGLELGDLIPAGRQMKRVVGGEIPAAKGP
jgi:predicted Zn-dependent protease